MYQLPADWTHASTTSTVTLVFAMIGLGALILRMRPLHSWRTFLLLIPIAMANLAVFQVVNLVKLPVQLVCLATVFIGIKCGPRAGVASGLATAILGSLVAPAYISFASIYAVVGLLAGLASYFGGYRNIWTTAITGAAVGLIIAMLAGPMVAMTYGDLPCNLQDAIAHQREAGGYTFLKAVVGNSLKLFPLDMVCTFLLAGGMMSLRRVEKLAPCANGAILQVA